MIKRTKRFLSDGYTYDWAPEIDPEKRDPLVGRNGGAAYDEWDTMLFALKEMAAKGEQDESAGANRQDEGTDQAA